MKRLAQILLFLVLSSGSLRAAHATEIKLKDDLGNEVVLKNPPQRIVSLAPSNTELLFAIGLGDRLVGVTDYCNFPEAANKIERVAGFNSLSAEKIVAVKPDLVVASRGNDQEGVEALRKFGIPVFALDIQTLDQMLVAIERLGKLGGGGSTGGTGEERSRRAGGAGPEKGRNAGGTAQSDVGVLGGAGVHGRSWDHDR